MPPPDSPRRKPRERHHHHHHHHRHRRPSHSTSPRKSRGHATSSDSSTQALSAGALAKLNYLNQQSPREPEITPKKSRQKRERVVSNEKYVAERSMKHEKRKKRRVVSGALLEEAEGEKLRGLRGGAYNYYEKVDERDSFFKRNKRLCLFPLAILYN
jgi:glucan 1,3-beta-glucosidase